MILEKKQHTPLLALCNGLPEEFSMFLRHCRLLDFEQQPDYTYLKAIFRDVMRRKGKLGSTFVPPEHATACVTHGGTQ